MDKVTADALVNRDESLPIVKIADVDDADASGGSHCNHEQSKKDRIKKHAAGMRERIWLGTHSETGPSMQDRLLEKLLQQVIPSEGSHNSHEGDSTTTFVERPSFNITTMSNNFRRFNARIGVVFIFQAKAIRLLSWKHTSHTLSFLSVYTFVCLDPYLISVLPLFGIILALLVPSFITRHPAAPNTDSSSDTVPYSPFGPPIAPASTVKPAKELSKDFFRNMRDLQNCMEDFSQVHDKLVAILMPPTNFSNEALSSTIFVLACFTCAFFFLASHLMPWRFIFLSTGWILTCSGHPTIQRKLLTVRSSSAFAVPSSNSMWSHFQSLLNRWIAHDIILDTPPEIREVEIFELQKLYLSSGEWESWVFAPNPYDPLSAARLGGCRPQGTRFFEDVKAPDGWEWSEKKWALDLWSREWVEERIITGVEVETEGERWVYDIKYEDHDEVWDDEGTGTETPTKTKGKGSKGKNTEKEKLKEDILLSSWEEGVDASSGRGDWRRRRWVRMVKRKVESRHGEGK